MIEWLPVALGVGGSLEHLPAASCQLSIILSACQAAGKGMLASHGPRSITFWTKTPLQAPATHACTHNVHMQMHMDVLAAH